MRLKMCRWPACIGLALVLCGMPAISRAAPSHVALVIGNSAYQHTAALANPQNDASDMAEALKRLGFRVVVGIDLGIGAMAAKVREFAKAARGSDVAVVFYAGHGLQVDGRNYLVPVDARLSDESDLTFETMELSDVVELSEKASATSVVFLDACRDNPLARDLVRAMGAARSGAVGRGLAQVEIGVGTLIAYATQPGNVALDGTGRNSPFTTALLAHIETPGLEVNQFMNRVRQSVLVATENRQVPWTHSSLTGDVFFSRRAEPDAEPAPPAVAQTGRDMEALFWESIKDSENPADFADYLAQFPDGVFSGLAQRRMTGLQETETAALPPPAKPAPEPAPERQITPLDELMVAVRTANVRAAPTTDSARIGRLETGTEVSATGRTATDGGDWYRIALTDGGEGYVFGKLLQDQALWAEAERVRLEKEAAERAAQAEAARREAERQAAERERAEAERLRAEQAAAEERRRQEAEAAAAKAEAEAQAKAAAARTAETNYWTAMRDRGDAASLEAYLSRYPQGRYAGEARAALAAAEVERERQVAVAVPPADTAATGESAFPAAFIGTWEGKAISSPGYAWPFPVRITITSRDFRIEYTRSDCAGTMKLLEASDTMLVLQENLIGRCRGTKVILRLVGDSALSYHNRRFANRTYVGELKKVR